MDLNAEIWAVIDSKPRIPAEVKRSLHVEIVRLIEESRRNPGARKLGVTVMTEAGSLAGNKTAADRHAAQNPGDAKPKTV